MDTYHSRQWSPAPSAVLRASAIRGLDAAGFCHSRQQHAFVMLGRFSSEPF
jgi:hypothetical protein